MPTLSEPVAVVKAVFEACIGIHERMRDHGPAAGGRRRRGDSRRPRATAARCCCSATAAAPPTRSTWPRIWSGRFQRERRPVAALALTTDTSVLTAVANDYAFDRVFVRQIEALGNRGDIAFGISTSGRSANVVAGLRAASARGLRTIAMTGRDGGTVGGEVDIHINVPDPSTARVQEAHRTLIHAICELVEREL